MQVTSCLAAVTVLLCLVLCDGSSHKKGMGVAWWAYVCGDMDVLQDMAWWYDWQQETKHYITWYHCNEMRSHRWNYVPMINKVNNETFHLENHTHAGFVLGYNEPNHFAHGNVTGREAAAHWREVERAAPGKKLVSPAAAPCGGSSCHGDALEWFDEFFHHCHGCRVDYIATHIYDCNATKVMDYLQQVYNRYGKKIWLTEFACPNTHSAARQLTFMKEVLPLLEAAHYVYRYAWFVHRWRVDGFVTSSINIMHNKTATLTPLGQYYVDFGSTQPVVG